MAFSGANDCKPDKHTGLTYKGREIILIKERGHPKVGLVAMGLTKGLYPPEKVVEAATIYAVTGNLQKTSELVKVPLKDLRKLTKTDDFLLVLREVREENSEYFDIKMSSVIKKALEKLESAIDDGDSVLNKHGEVVQLPVKAKDLAFISSITFDKLQLQRGKPTSLTGNTDTARLEKLAMKFIELAQRTNQIRTPITIEAETPEYAPSPRTEIEERSKG